MSRTLRLGAFIVATLLLFTFGIFWIGSHQFRFSHTYRLMAAFRNVAGLTEGAAVRVGGVHQGTVRQIVLPNRPDQNVRIEMDLNDATRHVIKKDSHALIRTEGLVGDQYIEITFGSVDAPGINDGDTIAAEPPLEISDIIKKTNSILDSVQIAMQNVRQTAGNLQAISSKVNNGQGSLGGIINDRSIYQNVNQAATNLKEDTEALKHNFFLRGFFQDRGYQDAEDLKRNTIAGLPKSAPALRFDYRAGKIFDKPDTAKIKNGKELDAAGRFLEQNPYDLAVVASYGDQKGDTSKQLALTQARAAVARDYLIQHFKLDDTRIKIFGAGKSENAPDGGALAVLIYSGGKPNSEAK